MSVIGRDVMERGRGALPLLLLHGVGRPPALERSGESLSHTDMQAWTAASSHNRPEAVRSAAALSEARSGAVLGRVGLARDPLPLLLLRVNLLKISHRAAAPSQKSSVAVAPTGHVVKLISLPCQLRPHQLWSHMTPPQLLIGQPLFERPF